MLGLTYIVTESALFMGIRVWLARVGGTYMEVLVYCAACTGFWAGVFVAMLGQFRAVSVIPTGDTIFWMPFASCALGALYAHFRGEHPTYALEASIIEQSRNPKEPAE